MRLGGEGTTLKGFSSTPNRLGCVVSGRPACPACPARPTRPSHRQSTMQKKRKFAKINSQVELPTRSCSLQAGCRSGQDLPPRQVPIRLSHASEAMRWPSAWSFFTGFSLGAGNDQESVKREREREQERGETQLARADRGTLHEKPKITASYSSIHCGSAVCVDRYTDSSREDDSTERERERELPRMD